MKATGTRDIRQAAILAACAALGCGCLSTIAQSVVLAPITAPWRYATNNLNGVNMT